MPKVIITRSWPDGDAVQVVVKVDSSYPDALCEGKRTALDAYAEALGVTLARDETTP